VLQQRREVIVSESEAIGIIQNGNIVSIGGFITSSHPMALIREIIRRGLKDLGCKQRSNLLLPACGSGPA
jgi:acyl CoA:acetate/3-ketoacid CoA transferase alpha subunit